MLPDSATGRRSTDDDALLARALYEVMEEISDDPPGPRWEALVDGERGW